MENSFTEKFNELREHLSSFDDVYELFTRIFLGKMKDQFWIRSDIAPPSNDRRVMVVVPCPYKREEVMIDTDRHDGVGWVRWGDKVQYWCEIPFDPPKPKVVHFECNAFPI